MSTLSHHRQRRQRQRPITGYKIRVEGRLDAWLAEQFSELKLRNRAGGQAVLSGPLPDQAALMGLLLRLHHLGLTLLKVEAVREHADQPAARTLSTAPEKDPLA